MIGRTSDHLPSNRLSQGGQTTTKLEIRIIFTADSCLHFKKMDTGSALHVFSYDTSAALRNLVQKKAFSKDLLTTAWFIEKTKRWFDLCSSRCQKTALSLAKPEKYKEAVNFLNEYVKIIREVKIGAKGKTICLCI